jgi:hypothetical protein
MPMQQWSVRREFLRRLKQVLDQPENADAMANAKAQKRLMRVASHLVAGETGRRRYKLLNVWKAYPVSSVRPGCWIKIHLLATMTTRRYA